MTTLSCRIRWSLIMPLALTAIGTFAGKLDAGVRSGPSAPVFPLKVSADKRYLVDQRHVPFLIAGDSPQGLMGRLSELEADFYFANREAHGFNTAGWIDVTCGGHDYPDNVNATTPDGVPPFSGFVRGGTDYRHYDLGRPNEKYFVRLDHIVQIAARHHQAVFLNPMETIGWLPVLRNNGLQAAYAYGQYLGRRYKRFDNVLWLNGNDFNNWRNSTDDALVQAVAKGIRSVDPDQLQTVELNVFTSSSFDDPTWIPLIDLNSTYTYSPTYMQMLHSYNQKPVAPAYLVEGHYDLEDVGRPSDFGKPAVLRRQEYWTILTGGAGQFYGNSYTWSFKAGWRNHLDTPGAAQLQLWKQFFTALPWQELVPDRDHSILTAGFGVYGTFETRVSQSDYATAAATPDGKLVVVYMPTARTVTVNMRAARRSVRARWFDPSIGGYQAIPGSPFRKSNSHQFTPPGRNHDGDSDWVLLLDAR